MTKKLLLTFAFVFSFAIFSFGQSKALLKDGISQINQACPVDLGAVGSMTKVAYDDIENQVSFHFQFDSNLFSSSKFEETAQTMKQTIMGAWAATESSRKLMEIISSIEASLIIVINNEYKIDFTADEIKSIADGRTNSISAKEYFENSVKTVNAQCPIAVDEITFLKNASLEDEYFVYNYVFVEGSGLKPSDFNKEIIKTNISASLNSGDVSINQMIGWCKEGNMGIMYRYWFEDGQKIDIVFTPEDIKKMKGDRVK